LLRRQLERRLALAIELVGDRRPDESHDHCDPRHQLDAQLADGFRGHGRGSFLARSSRSAGHSAFAPDEITTFSHFAVSAAITLPKSSGEPLIGVPPNSTSRFSIPGSESAAFTDAFTLSIASRGEPF